LNGGRVGRVQRGVEELPQNVDKKRGSTRGKKGLAGGPKNPRALLVRGGGFVIEDVVCGGWPSNGFEKNDMEKRGTREWETQGVRKRPRCSGKNTPRRGSWIK